MKMIRIRDKEKADQKLRRVTDMMVFWKRFILIIAILFIASEPVAVAAEKVQMPLIIMGGRWSGIYRPEYSDLSRVCHAGFTHVFSFSIESSINAKFAPQSMLNTVNLVEELASLVQRDCPELVLVVGIPRAWIYRERYATIKKYILAIADRGIAVDYWYSDEMILQMVRLGFSLEKAVDRARKTVEAVKEVSDVPYIWNEAGRYNSLTKSIVRELAQLDIIAVKAFDEYTISKKGRLTQKGLSSIRGTLEILKGKNNIVFPILEINRTRGVEPGQEELATLLVTMMMDGARGFIFYEERLSTIKILQRLAKVNALVSYLENTEIHNFQKKIYSRHTIWKTRSADRIISVIFNSGTSELNTSSIVPKGAVIRWPLNTNDYVQKSLLKPLEILVFTEDAMDRRDNDSGND
jgi:hypothetical protein